MSFEQDIDRFIDLSEARLEAVFKQGAQDLAEAVQKPKARGGRMPVDTRLLTNSFAAAVNSTPRCASGEFAATDFDMMPIAEAILSAQLGDRIVFGYGANYAKYMEAENAFIRANAQNWQQIVKEAVRKVKGEFRA